MLSVYDLDAFQIYYVLIFLADFLVVVVERIWVPVWILISLVPVEAEMFEVEGLFYLLVTVLSNRARLVLAEVDVEVLQGLLVTVEVLQGLFVSVEVLQGLLVTVEVLQGLLVTVEAAGRWPYLSTMRVGSAKGRGHPPCCSPLARCALG